MAESDFVDVHLRLNCPYGVTAEIKSIKLLPFTCIVVMTMGAYHNTAAGHATRVSVTYFTVHTDTVK